MSAKKAIIVRSGEPIVQLRPPQRRVFRHKSGILFFIWRRQCGKSYALAIQALEFLEARVDGIRYDAPASDRPHVVDGASAIRTK